MQVGEPIRYRMQWGASCVCQIATRFTQHVRRDMHRCKPQSSEGCETSRDSPLKERDPIGGDPSEMRRLSFGSGCIESGPEYQSCIYLVSDMLLTIDPSLLAQSSSAHSRPRPPAPIDISLPLSRSSSSDEWTWPASSGYLSASASSSSSGSLGGCEGDQWTGIKSIQLGRDAFEVENDAYRLDMSCNDEATKRSLGFTLPAPPRSVQGGASPRISLISASANGITGMSGINRSFSINGSNGVTPASTMQLNGTVQGSGASGSATGTGTGSGRKRKKKYSRSRLGCLTCRSRKVRCDETRPVCEKCSDLERVVRRYTRCD